MRVGYLIRRARRFLHRLANDLRMDVGNNWFVKAVKPVPFLATDSPTSPCWEDVFALRTTT